MLDWEWYKDSNTTRLFLHCLLKANHKENKWQGILIKRGSFVTSYQTLALELGLTVQNIRTSIKRLNSTGELTHKSHSKYGIITINNYDRYQDVNSQTNSQLTVSQQSSNSQVTTNNNDNNENNENNETIVEDVPSPSKPKRKKYGSHVLLIPEQYENIVKEYGIDLVETIIERMNEYIGMKGKTYKDYNLAIRKWIREEVSNNPKWLTELKREQEAYDNIKIESKRDKKELEDAWSKL
jgi:hypothetical protein